MKNTITIEKAKLARHMEDLAAIEEKINRQIDQIIENYPADLGISPEDFVERVQRIFSRKPASGVRKNGRARKGKGRKADKAAASKPAKKKAKRKVLSRNGRRGIDDSTLKSISGEIAASLTGQNKAPLSTVAKEHGVSLPTIYKLKKAMEMISGGESVEKAADVTKMSQNTIAKVVEFSGKALQKKTA